ncbi:MAG: hypothetical protein AAGH15_25935 [Myxococcota bacterium]
MPARRTCARIVTSTPASSPSVAGPSAPGWPDAAVLRRARSTRTSSGIVSSAKLASLGGSHAQNLLFPAIAGVARARVLPARPSLAA